jgi:hypothetical protein
MAYEQADSGLLPGDLTSTERHQMNDAASQILAERGISPGASPPTEQALTIDPSHEFPELLGEVHDPVSAFDPGKAATYGSAWRAYVEAVLAGDGQDASRALNLMYDTAGEVAMLASAMGVAGHLIHDVSPMRGLEADEEEACYEVAEVFARMASQDDETFEAEMSLYLPLVTTVRSGGWAWPVLSLGLSVEIVSGHLFAMIDSLLLGHVDDGWALPDLLADVARVAVEIAFPDA